MHLTTCENDSPVDLKAVALSTELPIRIACLVETQWSMNRTLRAGSHAQYPTMKSRCFSCSTYEEVQIVFQMTAVGQASISGMHASKLDVHQIWTPFRRDD